MRVAAVLGWHVLDSGALYRLAALTVINHQIAPDQIGVASKLARSMQIQFDQGLIRLDGKDVTSRIRDEDVGNLASELAKAPQLREALLERQRAFRMPVGLVADGRDMGTVVFPDAPLKIYLQAAVQARAMRRFQQLADKGGDVSYERVLEDLMARDDRDINRAAAPLRPAVDAHIIDSSNLTIEQTVSAVLDLWAATACAGTS